MVSVVISVYNERPHLEKAVRSILNNTFENFEFIIVNDGSTDGSKKVLERFADQDDRIRLIHQKNQGTSAAVNLGLNEARGAYIARMDGDDISHPQRFDRQVRYLRTHPEIGVVGTKIKHIDAEGRARGTWPLPTDPDTISWRLVFNTCLCNPSTMIRHTLIDELGGYAEGSWPAEDYEFWTRAVQVTRLANIPETLLEYRHHEGSATVSKRRDQICACVEAATNLHRVLLGSKVDEKISKFVVWMEVEGIERAVEETNMEDFAAVHEYVRTLYGACSRQLVSEVPNIGVRQQAMSKLDTIAERIAQQRGLTKGLRHKIRSRCMEPVQEILPYGIRAIQRRIS